MLEDIPYFIDIDKTTFIGKDDIEVKNIDVVDSGIKFKETLTK
jgi:hypothetical protein